MDTALADRAPIDLPAMIEKLRGCIAEEERTGYRPRTASDVPVAVGDVTAEWLTAVLCADIPRARVESVEVAWRIGRVDIQACAGADLQ